MSPPIAENGGARQTVRGSALAVAIAAGSAAGADPLVAAAHPLNPWVSTALYVQRAQICNCNLLVYQC